MINTLGLEQILLLVVIAALLAIIYVLRILISLQRDVANIEVHLEKLVMKLLKEEGKLQGVTSTINKEEKEELSKLEEIDKEIKRLLEKKNL